MALDRKIKQAAINTALRHQLKNLSLSRERVCRNLIDFGLQLNPRALSTDDLNRLHVELMTLLNRMQETPAESTEAIRRWMNERFL